MLDRTMRKKLKEVYGDYIRGVFIDDMPREQVYAIYRNCEVRGLFKKPKKLKSTDEGYQWSISDYI